MNNCIHTFYKRAARIQAWVCGSLFFAFSFVYLFMFQRDVVEALHFSLAHGKTQYAPLVSAVTISIVLLLLKNVTGRLLKLTGKWHSWAYFPSCLVLGALTDVGRDVYMDTSHCFWIWFLPIALLAYAMLTWGICHIIHFDKNLGRASSSMYLGTNLFVLFGLCMIPICFGNTNSDFHHELQAERYLRMKQYDKVLHVGLKSQKATRTLTALRAMAMSCEGTMGDKLFLYPQDYKSEGLFFEMDSLKTLRYTNDSLYRLLGVRPYLHEPHLIYLKNINYKGTGKEGALDYYLSALLLDKRLDEFSNAIIYFYRSRETLPRYYMEAMMLCAQNHFPLDSLIVQHFSDFKAQRMQFRSSKNERKEMKNEFGDTYWWYYYYQE